MPYQDRRAYFVPKLALYAFPVARKTLIRRAKPHFGSEMRGTAPHPHGR